MPNDPEIELVVPYCTKNWANTFFGEYLFDEYWNSASDPKKTSGLKAATDFINLYCVFHDENGDVVTFTPDGTDDYTDAVIPRRLKQACAQEAAYLLSLDDNPAEPHPLTILGLLRGDFGTVDDRLVPPIFSKQVVKLLGLLGGEIDIAALGPQEFGFAEKNTTN